MPVFCETVYAGLFVEKACSVGYTLLPVTTSVGDLKAYEKNI